jgi:hypothetical protein
MGLRPELHPVPRASNVSRCAKVEECSLVGLKSHDSHILMQQLMPIALRGSLTKKVVEPLIALSGFFREICSKMLRLEDWIDLSPESLTYYANWKGSSQPDFSQ